MNDILKAAGIAAATIVGMYAGAVVCAVATGAIIKKAEGKETEAPKQEQPQAQAQIAG